MRNLLLGILGFSAAAWMGAGHWLFGLGGQLSWWYVPLLTLPYALLNLATIWRLSVARHRGRQVGRAPLVALTLSWVCALGFGFTVPNLVNGELISILGQAGGASWNDMAIALCNPFGILAFATVIAALIFAILAGRDPRPDEDELLDAAEAAGTAPAMAPHPLSQ